MKALYFGDKHEQNTTPENRLDNYRDTQKTKTREIRDIGRRLGVDFFVQPGDFLNTPNPSLEFISEVIEDWTGQKKDLFEIFGDFLEGKLTAEQARSAMKDFTPIIGVAGNHELYGNNLGTLHKTAIGFLSKIGMMRFATKKNPYIINTEDGLKIAITGTHYHIDIDNPEHLDDYIVEEKLGDYHIHIVHGMLSDKDMGEHIRHTLVDHIKHTKADLTISGHDHIGFDPIQVDGKWFVNPGAPVRQKNDVKEMKRNPRVMVIEITKAAGLSLRMIPLMSAQAGEVVLNRKKIVERRQREDRIEDFKKAVRDAGITKSTDISTIIRDIAENKNLPKHIRDDIIHRISEKKRIMNVLADNAVSEAFVERIVLENFQSHEYTDLVLSHGLNLLIGESRQGKTAILRGFQWVYTNKPTGKRIIKRGKEYARVTLYLSNGYIVSRYMDRKESGKNGFFITNPDTGEEEYSNTKMLPEVQRILGYSPYVIDKDLSYNLNFMKQGSGWFLIGDDFTAPVKAKVIGGIYGTQYADAVARDLDAEDKRVNENIRSAQNEMVQLEQKLISFDYLPDLENRIQHAEQLLEQIQSLQARRVDIVRLVTKRKEIEQVVDEETAVIQALDCLEQANLLTERVKLEQFKRNQISTTLMKRREVEKKYNLLRESLDAAEHLDEARAVYEDLAKKTIQSSGIRQVLAKRKNIIFELQEAARVEKGTQFVEEAGQMLMEFTQSQHRRKELHEKTARAKRLEGVRDDVSRKLRMIEETLTVTTELSKAQQLFSLLNKGLERKEAISKVVGTRFKLKKQISGEDAQIKQANNETARLVGVYKGLLEQAGSCPVCHGTIDKLTVDRIVQEYQTA